MSEQEVFLLSFFFLLPSLLLHPSLWLLFTDHFSQPLSTPLFFSSFFSIFLSHYNFFTSYVFSILFYFLYLCFFLSLSVWISGSSPSVSLLDFLPLTSLSSNFFLFCLFFSFSSFLVIVHSSFSLNHSRSYI